MTDHSQELPSRKLSGAGRQHRRSSPQVNVNHTERVASAVLGGSLLTLMLRRRSLGGAVAALAGGELLYRGISGHCHLYEALGLSSENEHRRRKAETGAGIMQVERSITIAKPADELYRAWRDPQTLARTMAHFAEVTAVGEDRQHWRVRTPGEQDMEWDSRIVDDRPGEHLGWESLTGAELPNRGSVSFRPAPGGRGTEVTLRLRFEAPGGTVGQALAKRLGVPRLLVLKGLHRFKSLVEAGEIPTLEHNPSARTVVRTN